MASNIRTADIDIKYPEPGKDNDTSGFRNNFESIRDNFDVAKTEIEDLQSNTARTDESSDFNGSTIRDGNLLQVTKTAFAIGNTIDNEVIDFRLGSYHSITATADIQLTLIGLPDPDRFAKITVSLLSDGQNREISFVTEGTGIIKKNIGTPIQLFDSTDGFNTTVGGFPETLIANSATNPLIVEFWTVDGGSTVYANYIGQFV